MNRLVSFTILIIILLLACNDKKSLIYIGDMPIMVEIADTPDKRSKGLSNRKRIDGGMLFVFEKDDRYPFCMRDTYIPLSIAFINRQGVIVSIQDMDIQYKNRLYFPPVPILYALEVEMGWFEQNGIKVGDRVKMSTL